MIQSILPIARVAAPYVVKGIVKTAVTLGITTGIVYTISRALDGKAVHAGKTETNVEFAKTEAKYAGRSLKETVKVAAIPTVLIVAGEVITPVFAPVGVTLIVAGYAVIAVPLIRDVVSLSKDVRQGFEDAKSEPTVVMDFEADKVSPEAHAMWDEAALEDTEVELAELDIARFERTPGKAGAQFAEALHTTDPVNLGIARALLRKELVAHNVADNKITQALAGFDRVLGLGVA